MLALETKKTTFFAANFKIQVGSTLPVPPSDAHDSIDNTFKRCFENRIVSERTGISQKCPTLILIETRRF